MIQQSGTWFRHRSSVSALVGLSLFVLGWCSSTKVMGCPFCSNMGKTLAEDVNEAAIVLFGKLQNAKPNDTDGTTELHVQRVIKGHPLVDGKSVVILPRYIPVPKDEDPHFLVFAAVLDKQLDPYRLLPAKDPELIEYIAKSVYWATKPGSPEKLAFMFQNLDSKIQDVSADAYKEFAAAPFNQVKDASKSYGPEKLMRWMESRDTEGYKIGLFGVLLGTCGRPQDAAFLRAMVENSNTRPLTGVDGLMGGYCLLDPKAGPDFVLSLLVDKEKDFNLRYAALRTVRFLLTEMPEVDRKQLFQRMEKGILLPDMSDLIIDEFRNAKVWTPLELVLSLEGKPEFKLQVIRRAMIRFCLKCPDPRAAAYIAKLRKSDPQLVADVEEILRFEDAVPAKSGN